MIALVRNRTNPKGLITVFFLLTMLIVLLSLSAPSTLFSLRVNTELADLKVVSPATSRLYLPSAYDEIEERCFTDLSLVPSVGAQAFYSRRHNGPLFIALRGNWQNDGGIPAVSSNAGKTGYRSYRVGAPDDGCAVIDYLRLPANGLLTIGSENVASPDEETLVTGPATVNIFARSIDRILGVIKLDFGPFRSNTLYHVETFRLPSGSRISNAKSFDDRPATWWGLVGVSFDDTGMALDVSANALSFELYTPAPRLVAASTIDAMTGPNYVIPSGAENSADVVLLSFGSRLLDDPNLQWLYAITAIMIGLIQIFSIGRRRGRSAP